MRKRRLQAARRAKRRARRQRQRPDAGSRKVQVLHLPASRDAGTPPADGGASPDAGAPAAELPPLEPYVKKPDQRMPAGAQWDDWKKGPEKERDNTAALVNGATSFSMNLFTRVPRPRGAFALPVWDLHGLMIALFDGSNEDTRKALKEAAHLTLDVKTLLATRRSVAARLSRGARGGRPRVFGALWSAKEAKPRAGLPANLAQRYGLRWLPVELKTEPERSRKKINAWGRKQLGTGGDDLIRRGALHVETQLAPTLALDWKVPWGMAISTLDTKPGTFYLPDCKMTQVTMMQSVPVTLGLAQPRGLMILDVPLKGGAYAITLVLPPTASAMGELMSQLTADRLRFWLRSTRPREVRLSLPRMEIWTRLELRSGIGALGLEPLFSKDAQLAGISPTKGFHPQNVWTLTRQRWLETTRARVKQTGRKVGLPPRLRRLYRRFRRPVFRPRRVRRIFVDRPFLFFVRHRQTGAILVAGRVDNPRPGARKEQRTCDATSSRTGRARLGPARLRVRVLGGLARQVVQPVVDKKAAALSACVANVTKAKPHARGWIKISFNVSMGGTVAQAYSTSRGFSHPPTLQCIEKILRGLTFPRNPDEPTLVGLSVRVGSRAPSRVRRIPSWRRRFGSRYQRYPTP